MSAWGFAPDPVEVVYSVTPVPLAVMGWDRLAVWRCVMMVSPRNLKLSNVELG